MKRIAHLSPDLLDETGFADGLDDEERSEILQITERRHYEDGEVIVKEGESSRDVYGLKSGRAEVIKRDEHGAEQKLAVLEPGTVFGEVALVLGEPRSATVRAADDGVDLFCIDGEALTSMRQDQKLAAYKLEHNILQMLARRQSALNHELLELMDSEDSEAVRRSAEDVRERLLEQWQF
ncbi:MAG: cyclic nucleotide-binding domain-containing protein [Bradymonadaceae bacterium]